MKRKKKKAWSYFHRNWSWCFGHSVISSLHACRGPMLVFWGTGLLPWFHNQTCPNKDALAGSSGVGFGIRGLWPLTEALCFFLKSNSADGWRVVAGGVTPPSHPREGDSRSYCSGGLHRKVNNLLICVPGFHQILALSLSMPGCLYAQCHSSPVLSLVGFWDSKQQS